MPPNTIGSSPRRRKWSFYPSSPPGREPDITMYVVRTEDRDRMMKPLKKKGIGSGIHYPIPLNLQKAYARMNYSKGDFRVTKKAAAEIVSLPNAPAADVRATGSGSRRNSVLCSVCFAVKAANRRSWFHCGRRTGGLNCNAQPPSHRSTLTRLRKCRLQPK
jgi:DegT/DnrJ/EryC1/StrS aminotransferase family